jgi:sulfur relay (sulfurtransferase) DsrF/TusC family protein
MKILQIIHTAYRATTEEQDDTVVWLTHAMTAAGGRFDVVLMGNAVNYCARGQSAEGLAFGDWKQTQPPNLERDITGLIDKGVRVYVVADDADETGLEPEACIEGVRRIGRAEVAGLCDEYDQVWRW